MNDLSNKSLTRRRFLAGSAAATTAVLPLARAAFAAGAPACTLVPEQETGPFYVSDELLRSDIREDREGIPLGLHITLIDATTCLPLRNVAVDLWHCDAMGLYSGFTNSAMGGPGGFGGPSGPGGAGGPGGDHHGPPLDANGHPLPPPGGGAEGGPGGPGPGMKPSDKLTFLRGIQITGTDGSVDFQTIYPGFYDGRTNHIHFKARFSGYTKLRPDDAAHRTYAAGHTAHVGQIFLPEELTVKLMETEPYRSHHIHRLTHEEDGVFTGQHGVLSMAGIKQLDPSNAARGYSAAITLAVDPKATPAPVAMGGFGGPA